MFRTKKNLKLLTLFGTGSESDFFFFWEQTRPLPSPLHSRPYITKSNGLVAEVKNITRRKVLSVAPAFSSYDCSQATISVAVHFGSVRHAQYVDWSIQPTSLVLLAQLNLLLIRQRWIWIYYHPWQIFCRQNTWCSCLDESIWLLSSSVVPSTRPPDGPLSRSTKMRKLQQKNENKRKERKKRKRQRQRKTNRNRSKIRLSNSEETKDSTHFIHAFISSPLSRSVSSWCPALCR